MFLYIDPGTGSMLFSILIGIVSTVLFFGQRLFMKIKFIISGGKAKKISDSKIPYVIFTDHKRYWNVFKPICDEFEKRKINLVYWTASPDDPALNKKYEFVKAEFIGEGNKAFARLNMMNAGICLSTTPGLDVYQWKRSDNVDCYVHIRHDVEEPVGYRMFGCDFYDVILLTGEHQEYYIRLLEKLREEKEKECVITGCTYLDAMKARLENLRKENQNNNPKQKTILLAPTWGASGILSKYGEKIIDSLISTGYKIIIRPHPQSKKSEADMLSLLEERYKDNQNVIWDYERQNIFSLKKADIMISDFSGIIYDYTFLFDKPVMYVTAQMDLMPYDAYDLPDNGKNIWSFRSLNQIGIELKEEEFTNIKQIIQNASDSEELKQLRHKTKVEAWRNEGLSGTAVVDYMISKVEKK